MNAPVVADIVEEWLKLRGFEGLYNLDGECGCEVGALGPCYDGIRQECMAGYKVPCECHGFVIAKTRDYKCSEDDE
jgi:hypothetical protein